MLPIYVAQSGILGHRLQKLLDSGLIKSDGSIQLQAYKLEARAMDPKHVGAIVHFSGARAVMNEEECVPVAAEM